jgi:hypothetical protein
MATTIVTKNSATAGSAPSAGALSQGELAVNVADKRLFTKDSGGSVVEVGTNPGGAVTFTAGSASAPAITTTGDTNTGIFFPAADTIAFSEGGTEAMRIDSSGNVGIGSSNINGFYGSSSVATRGLIAYSTNSTSVDTSPKGLVIRNDDTTTNNLSQLVFATINTSGSPVATASVYSINDARGTGFNTGSLGFGTVGGSGIISERMRLDTASTLTLSIPTASSTFFGYKIKAGTDVLGAFQMDTNNGQLNLTAGYSGWGGFFTFTTNGSERMRLDSSGRLLINTTSAPSGVSMAQIAYAPDSQVGLALFPTNTNYNNASVVFMNNAASTVGFIYQNGSSTTYSTTSDYRLKENVAPMTGALNKVVQLKPVTYNWKVDGANGQGFIAHELAEVVPECVSGEKDAVNKDGSIKPQGIDTSFLVATLTAAIQEQQAIITQLQADVATLKGTV